MPNIHQCHIAKSEILKLEVLNNSLIAYTTKSYAVTIFDFLECTTKSSIINEHLNLEVTASVFSPDAKMLAFANKQTIYIVNIIDSKIIQAIETHGETIEILNFDSSSNYIRAVTKNGSVLQYRYNTPLLLSRVCMFAPNEKNSVNSCAFYKHYLACSGLEGSVYITDLRLLTNTCTIQHNRDRCDALCFLDKDTIISGNTNGEIYITSLIEVNSYKCIKTHLLAIKQILLMQNPNYIMVTGKNNIVSIIDIKKYKISRSKYLEFDSNINKIAIADNNNLIVALQNKKILHVELPSEEELMSLILHNSIDEAYQLTIKEPILQDSHAYKVLEEKFDKAYLKATKALINHDINNAVKLLDLYKNIKSKQFQIKNLFDGFKNYTRFKDLIYEEKYALAYAMSSKFPALKETIEYKKMEQNFKNTFANAQKLVLKGKIKDAKNLISKYRTVLSKKPFLKMILTQRKEFIEFLKAIHVKDFKKINEIIDNNEFFEQLPNYALLNDEIENALKNVQKSIKSLQIKSAKEQLSTLKKVPHIKNKVEQLYLECANIINFIQHTNIMILKPVMKF